MTISQIRLFTVYLSKINPMEMESRVVTFKLDDYAKIMQFSKVNTTRLKIAAMGLLHLTFFYMDQTDIDNVADLQGFLACQIFKRIKFFKNDNGEWMMSIECHEDVMKFMFDLQRHYFKYQLWNTLQLTSPNQQRMYEILKQYEVAGVREISVKDLREYLGIEPTEYQRWDNFKARVLDASQEALANFTDIKFTWEVTGKRGPSGKIRFLKFYINKNDNSARQLTLDEYLIKQIPAEFDDDLEDFELSDETDCSDVVIVDGESNVESNPYTDRILMIMDACKEEFTYDEAEAAYNKMREVMPSDKFSDIRELFHYAKDRYVELNRLDRNKTIRNRFKYFKTLLDKEI